jgi:hypothetical protein
LILQAPGYHTRVQQFLLTGDAVREIALTSTRPTIHSDWEGYHGAPDKVKRLIDQALALLGDDVQVYETLNAELEALATGSLHGPGQPHHKDIVCADLVTMALHAAGVNHDWEVNVPPDTEYNTSHAANYYRPSQHNPFLRVVGDGEAWLPGDILVYWDGDLESERLQHVNLYVGPLSGTDLSGNEHPASKGYEVVNASIDDKDPNSETGEATIPLTRHRCEVERCGYERMLRLRHRELWD